MPIFKNVRIKMANGKTRLQRAQVLKSGKLKFVKNLSSSSSRKRSTSSKRKNTPAKRSANRRKVSKTGKSKMLRTVGLVGAAEDIAWGFVGFNVLGKTVGALPMTRVIQGVAGHALDRRGKRRLVDGVLDLVTIWLSTGSLLGNGFGGGGAGVRSALSKITFL